MTNSRKPGSELEKRARRCQSILLRVKYPSCSLPTISTGATTRFMERNEPSSTCLDEDDLYEDDDTEISGTNGKKVAREGKQIYGDVYFDADANCNFGPIPLPTRARRKDVKVKSEDGKYDLRFKFFGNGYLKLSVSWDLAFMGGYNSSSIFPEMIEFVGILRDREKEKKERAEEQERIAKTRPASPRESWFEMNHPMGSWAQSHWGF